MCVFAPHHPYTFIPTYVQGGVHKQTPEEAKHYTAEELKLMATQDVAYVQHRRAQEQKVCVDDLVNG